MAGRSCGGSADSRLRCEPPASPGAVARSVRPRMSTAIVAMWQSALARARALGMCFICCAIVIVITMRRQSAVLEKQRRSSLPPSPAPAPPAPSLPRRYPP